MFKSIYSGKTKNIRKSNTIHNIRTGLRVFCDGNRGFWLRCNAGRVFCDGECQRVYCDGSEGFFATAREVSCDGERIVKVFRDGKWSFCVGGGVFCDGQRKDRHCENDG